MLFVDSETEGCAVQRWKGALFMDSKMEGCTVMDSNMEGCAVHEV